MGTEHKVKRTESKNVRKFYKAGVERVVREISRKILERWGKVGGTTNNQPVDSRSMALAL